MTFLEAELKADSEIAAQEDRRLMSGQVCDFRSSLNETASHRRCMIWRLDATEMAGSETKVTGPDSMTGVPSADSVQ